MQWLFWVLAGRRRFKTASFWAPLLQILCRFAAACTPLQGGPLRFAVALLRGDIGETGQVLSSRGVPM